MNLTDGVKLSDLDEFDALVLAKINHSLLCAFCRRLFTTLCFNPKLLENSVFVALVGEFIKTLSGSFCRSKCSFYINDNSYVLESPVINDCTSNAPDTIVSNSKLSSTSTWYSN